jgi:hypothetical protein
MSADTQLDLEGNKECPYWRSEMCWYYIEHIPSKPKFPDVGMFRCPEKDRYMRQYCTLLFKEAR